MKDQEKVFGYWKEIVSLMRQRNPDIDERIQKLIMFPVVAVRDLHKQEFI